VKVDGGLFQITVAEQNLNGPQIGAGLQQMSGEAVPQGVFVMLMILVSRRSAIAIIRIMKWRSK
jgi:hypothetical protein